MTPTLPPNASLEQLRKQAKDVLKAHKAGDPSCCAVLRHLRRFARSSDADILRADLGLQEVQHALAKDYGSAGWGALRAAIANDSPKPESAVRRDGGRTWIEGVESLGRAECWGYPRIACMAIAAKRLGVDTSYEYLVGVSGAAFRLLFQWCPSSPDPGVGYYHMRTVAQALGLTVDNIGLESADDREAARKRVVQNIDRGFPVLGIDLRVCPEWGVIVGYEDEGRTLFCRTIFDKGAEYTRAEKWPWDLDFLAQTGAPPSSHTMVPKSLRTGVELASTPAFGQYASGFAAYEAWIRDLRNDAKFDAVGDEQLDDLRHANGWMYMSLADARRSAVVYLRDIENEVPNAPSGHLLKAAALYEGIARLLQDGKPHVPWRLPPDTRGLAWTRPMRQAQAETLADVLRREREAVAELQRALETWT